MKNLLILAILLISVNSYAKLTVAVIDTGLSRSVVDLSKKPNNSWYEKGICKFGHKDFTKTELHDNHGHGTNISGLIHKYAKGNDYCQVILKYYDPNASEHNNLNNMIEAIRHAIGLNVDVINISGGGVEPVSKERVLIKMALDRGIKIVAAAGNERGVIDINKYYPASYFPEILVVGSTDNDGKRLPSSNYGAAVDVEEKGYMQVGEYGKPMTGTSQATAITTGKEVGRIFERQRRKLRKIMLEGKEVG